MHQRSLAESSRAERHKIFGARYGAIRRELEVLHATGMSVDEARASAVREKLDRLAEEAPAASANALETVQKRTTNS